MKKTYVSTPIYYVNDIPHIGHAYTTIIADSIARFARLSGNDTFFITGTDEHGQKIQDAAKLRNKSPKEYADEISMKFKNLWDEFEISYDLFIRTTDDYHAKSVQKAFSIMFNNGDIYKGEYEGHYCVSCESFYAPSQLSANLACPDCSKPTSIVKEESYFFKLSKYQDRILKYYERPDSILPSSRKNELINFVKSGLKDLSITRTSFEWGLKIPKELNDDKHIIYVWLDALINYLSGLGYGRENFNLEMWSNAIHIVGKDILRFHAVYWPAFLMSLNLPLPKHIVAHGWWLIDSEKMSKSRGNVVNPSELAKEYGIEKIRYFLLRESPFGQDGDFSKKNFIDRVNSDLSNNLGNLLSRTIAMSLKYNQEIHKDFILTYHKDDLNQANEYIKNALQYQKELSSNKYIEEILKLSFLANCLIAKFEPWNLAKENKFNQLSAILGLCLNLLAKISILLSPIMPKSCEKMANSMNFKIDNNSFNALIINEELWDFKVNKIEPLFPKIELNDTKKDQKISKNLNNNENKISIDDFLKLDIRLGTVIACSTIEQSDKLLRFIVDIGEEKPREILSGIAKHYNPSDLIGRQVCVLANLKPRTMLKKYVSNGMILSASDDVLSLIGVDKKINNGAKIS